MSSSTDCPATMAERRAAVEAAGRTLQGISQVLHQMPIGELGDLAGALGQLAALANAGLVAVTAEAEHRAVVEQSQSASTAGWVRDQAWHLQAGGAAVVAKCARFLRRSDLGGLADAVPPDPLGRRRTPTDLRNGALLCGRHHTIVHRDQLAGTVVDGQVLCDRKPGSYQRH